MIIPFIRIFQTRELECLACSRQPQKVGGTFSRLDTLISLSFAATCDLGACILASAVAAGGTHVIIAGIKWAWPHCRRVVLRTLQDGDQPPPPPTVMMRADPDSSSSSHGSDNYQPSGRMRVTRGRGTRVQWDPNLTPGHDASVRGRRWIPDTPGPNQDTPTQSTPRSTSSPPSIRDMGVQVDIEDDPRGAAGGPRTGAGGGAPLFRGEPRVIRPGQVRPAGVDLSQPPPSLGLHSRVLTPIRTSSRFSASRARSPPQGDIKPELFSDEDDPKK